MIKVKWFRHTHENRNDWLRFGLMELQAQNEINYQEWELKDMLKYGFSAEILAHPDLRHKSFILIENGADQKKCLVDSEDSFALFSELIVHTDSYFCSGFNTDLFVHKRVPEFYHWQTADEVKWYTKELTEKIARLGDHFHKVKKFIPIAPNLFKEEQLSPIKRLAYNLDDKLRKRLGYSSNYSLEHQIYKKRYQELLNLRNQKLTYDITLNDTLWGWPEHRIKLHLALKKLAAQGFKINSILKYGTPTINDNSIALGLKPEQFPMRIGNIENYEEMLAASKLGIFACGFHWGWRNILSLALFFGIPVITDRLLTEAYFDMNEFEIHETEDQNWKIAAELLKHTDALQWEKIKDHNQKTYDQYLKPEVVARYFITQCYA